ncbi:hypothetical protein D6764_04490 [Candidatus Woesearchaeota archaeon]|nr:MAG: hypothetical protein D6764_04490 [Candidatus Woesearchaeota archaeon]
MKLMNSKKAEMGVGTLIIFIAMLLVAAVAAGVLIQTAGSLQEKALSTGSQAKGQIATNVRVIEVSATNGENGTVKYFETIMKLAPGSDPVKITQAIFTFNTYDSTATLKYRGVNGLIANNVSGYLTYRVEELGEITTSNTPLHNDLDDDGKTDYVRVANASGNDNLEFVISNSGSPIYINVSLGADIDGASGSPVSISVPTTDVASGGTTYATVYINGTTDTNATLVASMNITITPENKGQGYFVVEYLQKGSNWVNGNLQRGDVIKMYFEAPRPVGEDEEIRMNFIPKIGTSTLTQFVTPEVISTERVYLYP